MHCKPTADSIRPIEDYSRVVLIGNANVGKSVLFGLLTGQYATVSNYPGTTVEISQGNLHLGGRKILLIDTPGVNSLIPMSEDEQVTRDILLRERASLVIQVADAKNLRRTLAITVQIAEMGLPLVLDLNMEDEARDRGINIDKKLLSELLGVDVIGTVAPERRGIGQLRAAIKLGSCPAPAIEVEYGPVIKEYVARVALLLPDAPITSESLALMILSGDVTLREWLRANLDDEALLKIEALYNECAGRLNRPASVIINEARLSTASALASRVMTKDPGVRSGLALRLGQASMHPVWGIPVLLAVLFGMYEFVGVLGADILVGLIEETVFGEYLNPMFTRLVEVLLPVPIVQEMLVGEFGLITMALTYAIGIILPITTTFFIAFAILEDSGYLPRLAIMSNRVFNVMGLSGKAVLPMVLGLGCGTMAVMTTRILETRRDRIIATFLLAMAVPCAAQLGVILGLLGGLSPLAMAIWIACVIGVLLVTGALASRVVKGEQADFLLEIPPIRRPSLTNIVVKTYGRVVWYLREAVPLFMLGTLALFILDKVKLLGVLERLASPVIVDVLGLPEKATQAFLIGFFRRDYGAAGLFDLAKDGLLDPVQTLVALVTLTLFVPCLAHFFMMIKERGAWLSLLMVGIILPVAVGVGGALNWALRFLGITL